VPDDMVGSETLLAQRRDWAKPRERLGVKGVMCPLVFRRYG